MVYDTKYPANNQLIHDSKGSIHYNARATFFVFSRDYHDKHMKKILLHALNLRKLIKLKQFLSQLQVAENYSTKFFDLPSDYIDQLHSAEGESHQKAVHFKTLVSLECFFLCVYYLHYRNKRNLALSFFFFFKMLGTNLVRMDAYLVPIFLKVAIFWDGYRHYNKY